MHDLQARMPRVTSPGQFRTTLTANYPGGLHRMVSCPRLQCPKYPPHPWSCTARKIVYPATPDFLVPRALLRTRTWSRAPIPHPTWPTMVGDYVHPYGEHCFFAAAAVDWKTATVSSIGMIAGIVVALHQRDHRRHPRNSPGSEIAAWGILRRKTRPHSAKRVSPSCRDRVHSLRLAESELPRMRTSQARATSEAVECAT